jgi:SAM-dependent methyltransferase
MTTKNRDDATVDSATTVYIERRVADLATTTGRQPLSVLDQRFAGHFGPDYDRHIRITSDPQSIPFDSGQFDLIVSNQVFEHVEHLDAILSECARVLKPAGALLTNFPLATTVVEPHVGVPFVHWMPPGSARQTYLRCAHVLARKRATLDKAAADEAGVCAPLPAHLSSTWVRGHWKRIVSLPPSWN